MGVEDSGGLESLTVTVDSENVAVCIQGTNWETIKELELNDTTGKAEIEKAMVIALVLGRNGRAGAKLLLLD